MIGRPGRSVAIRSVVVAVPGVPGALGCCVSDCSASGAASWVSAWLRDSSTGTGSKPIWASRTKSSDSSHGSVDICLA